MIINKYRISRCFLIICNLLLTLPYISMTHESRMVVVIASYNNNRLFGGKKLYKRNIDSVFIQNYENYRVIYIDDCSPDGTATAVEQYVRECGQEDRVTLIKNDARWGPSRNRYLGSHLCYDHEIVCILDGDDWFSHDGVLSRVNKEYASGDIWLTFSKFKMAPGGTTSHGKDIPDWVIKKHAYRQYGWCTHSLKTYYAWLFKKIRLEDLLYEKSFFPLASDLAEMFPMIEMAAGRFSFIPDILYIASQHAQNEVHTRGKELMVKITSHIMTKMKPYKPLEAEIAPDKLFSGIPIKTKFPSNTRGLPFSDEDFTDQLHSE